MGPVSQCLKKEITEEARTKGLLIWLDRDGDYSDFVDAWIAENPSFPVHGFRGSFLELLLSLENSVEEIDPSPTLIHMPGFNEETILKTPLLGLFRAGKRFRKSLKTLIEEAAGGAMAPVDIKSFVSNPDLSLELADKWMKRGQEQREKGVQSGLKHMPLPDLTKQLHENNEELKDLLNEPAKSQLYEELGRRLGMDAEWRDFVGTPQKSLLDIAYFIYCWALSVEYVNDLKRAPKISDLARLQTLPTKTKTNCKELVQHLRTQHPDRYERIADDFSARIIDELKHGKPEELGSIDTFRQEEIRVFQGALEALEKRDWKTALAWREERRGDAFWVERDESRRAEWPLIGYGAILGQAISQNQNFKFASVEEALEKYCSQGFEVDRAHRILEQRRKVLLEPHLKHFTKLRTQLDRLRELYREWADKLSKGFLERCAESSFLPTESMQQRQVFDRSIRPLGDKGKVAFFMVDALRFEMAVSLKEQILGAKDGADVKLSGALSELPSETSVGMNALAPVIENGRLTPVLKNGHIEGFKTATFQVLHKDERKRSMRDRIGGTNCPWYSLQDVINSDSKTLKKAVSQARLFIVHSLEIDKAGEAGAGLSVFEPTLRDLRNAWSKLREVGIQSFVFSADHGFLLNDEKTLQKIPFGPKTRPQRRHVYLDEAHSNNAVVSVSLSKLGYDQCKGYFAFPKTTAVFDTGKRDRSFVHGGPSLQERAIPILTVLHATEQGRSSTHYKLTASAGKDVVDMHCLKVRVEATSTGSFFFEKTMELALRVIDEEDVLVELCSVREFGAIESASFTVEVGKDVELFFKLDGQARERVAIEVYHPTAAFQMAPAKVGTRFSVAASSDLPAPSEKAIPECGADSFAWLSELPDDGTRQIFQHLARFNSITEAECVKILGTPRNFRRFSRKFDELQGAAPFSTRIEVTSDGKKYLKDI